MPAKAPARRVDAAELLREAEEAAGDAGMELLDSRGLKRLTLALERKVGAGHGSGRGRVGAGQPPMHRIHTCHLRYGASDALLMPTSCPDSAATPHATPQYNTNLEARMKYADQPDRFMDSEADLDEAVKALMVVASAPDLYPELVARWGGRTAKQVFNCCVARGCVLDETASTQLVSMPGLAAKRSSRI